MKLVIDIELGNAAMRTWPEVRTAIKEALMPVRLVQSAHNVNKPHPGDGGKIMDTNGNSVGTWKIVPDASQQEPHEITTPVDTRLAYEAARFISYWGSEWMSIPKETFQQDLGELVRLVVARNQDVKRQLGTWTQTETQQAVERVLERFPHKQR